MITNHTTYYSGPPSAELQFASRDDLLAFYNWFRGLEPHAPFKVVGLITSAGPALGDESPRTEDI